MSEITLLAKIQRALAPIDVYIRGAHTKVSEEFDAKNINGDLSFQIRYGVESTAETLEFPKEEDSQEKMIVLRYMADTGVRVVEDQGSGNSEKPLVRAEITAKWIVEYRVINPDDVNAEGIAEFGKENVMFHVWPYWREFIHATCARLRLPQVVLPMFSVRQSQSKNALTALESSNKEEKKTKTDR